MPIPIRIRPPGHGGIGARIVEQLFGRADDPPGVGAHHLRDTGVDGFGALGDLAQDEDGLREARRLFLRAAGVGEHQRAAFHQVDEFLIVDRRHQGDIRLPGQRAVDDSAHVGVGVHGVNDMHVGPAAEREQRLADALERRAEVLAAMRGDQQQPPLWKSGNDPAA